MTSARGSSVAEALVALALAGIALAALAASASSTVRSLRLARTRDAAVALAGARLEALRAGPRADGSETIGPFVRRWWVDDGRGDAGAIDVEVSWGNRTVRLASEVWP